MPSQTEHSALKVKLIKGATTAKTVKVDDNAGIGDSDWSQIDLVNPMDTNLAFVVGVAEHTSNNVFDTNFKWHQAALILDGEMILQDRDTKAVYHARKDDVFYWAPGLNVRIGGRFRAYFVRTPATWRWVMTPDGKKKLVNLFDIPGEISYPASPPEEIRKELVEKGKHEPQAKSAPLIKFVRNALKAEPVQLDDSAQMPTDGWRQIDLVNPKDTNIGMVVGIAQHPINTMNPNVSYFYYHQAALIIDGEMINHDITTGGVYRARKGDLFYWGPGFRMHIGGQFKAFFVKTPIPLRWTTTPKGKVVYNMIELENETYYPGTPPDEVVKSLITSA